MSAAYASCWRRCDDAGAGVYEPFAGPPFPVVPILRELQARGHTVCVRTLSGDVANLRSLGLRAEPLARDVEGVPVDDWQAQSPQDA